MGADITIKVVMLVVMLQAETLLHIELPNC
jgi:hypothetical protein